MIDKIGFLVLGQIVELTTVAADLPTSLINLTAVIRIYHSGLCSEKYADTLVFWK